LLLIEWPSRVFTWAPRLMALHRTSCSTTKSRRCASRGPTQPRRASTHATRPASCVAARSTSHSAVRFNTHTHTHPRTPPHSLFSARCFRCCQRRRFAHQRHCQCACHFPPTSRVAQRRSRSSRLLPPAVRTNLFFFFLSFSCGPAHDRSTCCCSTAAGRVTTISTTRIWRREWTPRRRCAVSKRFERRMV